MQSLDIRRDSTYRLYDNHVLPQFFSLLIGFGETAIRLPIPGRAPVMSFL